MRPAKLERALQGLARAKTVQAAEAVSAKRAREEKLLVLREEMEMKCVELRAHLMEVKKKMRAIDRAIDELHPRATLADVVAAIRRGNVVTLAGAGIR